MPLPERKPQRLWEYDYSQNGAYFVTICTQDRQPLFWGVGASTGRPQEKPALSESGIVAERLIQQIPQIYPQVTIDKYVIMPNHVHMLIMICSSTGSSNAGGRPMNAPTISHVIQQYKGAVTIIVGRPIWQKSYYDRILRDENEYLMVWRYIDENPLKWAEDTYWTL